MKCALELVTLIVRISLQCNVGVRQGDAISPILFNLHVSDFQSYIGFDTDASLLDTSFVNYLMYANDLVLISRSEVGLQGLIDKLGDYCKRWRMEVNTDKTKIIKFSGMVIIVKQHSFMERN